MSGPPQITVKPEYVDDIIAAIAELWRERQAKQLEANQQRLEYRQSLQNQIRATVRCHERNGAYVLGRGYY